MVNAAAYTLNVSGSSATIQSIVVNSGSFSVTLASGSSFSSPTLQQLSSDITSDVTNNTYRLGFFDKPRLLRRRHYYQRHHAVGDIVLWLWFLGWWGRQHA